MRDPLARIWNFMAAVHYRNGLGSGSRKRFGHLVVAGTPTCGRRDNEASDATADGSGKGRGFT